MRVKLYFFLMMMMMTAYMFKKHPGKKKMKEKLKL